jgi:outer membrane protein assembly factor BamB
MRTPEKLRVGPLSKRKGAARRSTVLVLTLSLAVIGALLGTGWYWRYSSVSWTVERGLALLAAAQTPAATVAALDEWERQTGRDWDERRDELIVHLFARCPLKDRRIRLLLTRAAGADYGERVEDWKRWLETRARLRRGEQPKVSARERIALHSRWQAAVGLTAWFTTIIPLDGQIYVASLGASFEEENGAADGIVRVDGQTGESQLIFRPPDGRLRDVLGLAAGDDCLFAACRNGYVYCVQPDGTLRWKTRIGESISGPPLSLDVNRDDVTDVMAVTSDGKVVALSGRNGSTIWATSGGRAAGLRRDWQRELGTTLAAGRLIDGAHADLVVTSPTGGLRVLAARNGTLRWKGTLATGALAGPVVCSGRSGGGPPTFVADRDARVWSVVRSGSTLEAVPAWDLMTWSGEGIVAALRTLAGADRPPLILASPTGSYSERRGSVCALEPGDVRWRYSPGGAIWATPAVADLNGHGQTQVVVASIETDAAGNASGVVTILSEHGHCLRRLTLSAPVECSPVVADLDGDNRLELLVADQAGWLHCWTVERSGPVEVQWGLFGGDSHNTRDAEDAYRYGQVPFGMQWRWKPD